MLTLWVKTFHIFFVIAWFAGMFYLPRLFVYHAAMPADDRGGHDRFVVMERRLYAMTTLGMIGTLGFGIWLAVLQPFWMQQGWMHGKLALVLLLCAAHGFLGASRRRFAAAANRISSRSWRVLNEVPTVLLLGVLILVVVKPF